MAYSVLKLKKKLLFKSTEGEKDVMDIVADGEIKWLVKKQSFW